MHALTTLPNCFVFEGHLCIHVLDHKHLLEPLAHPRLGLEMVDRLQVKILQKSSQLTKISTSAETQ